MNGIKKIAIKTLLWYENKSEEKIKWKKDAISVKMVGWLILSYVFGIKVKEKKSNHFKFTSSLYTLNKQPFITQFKHNNNEQNKNDETF